MIKIFLDKGASTSEYDMSRIVNFSASTSMQAPPSVIVTSKLWVENFLKQYFHAGTLNIKNEMPFGIELICKSVALDDSPYSFKLLILSRVLKASAKYPSSCSKGGSD